MPSLYNPNDWYWIVNGDTSRVWSSASAEFVSSSNSTYVAWLAAGNVPTRIDSNESLYAVLNEQCPGGLGNDLLSDAQVKATLITNARNKLVSKIAEGMPYMGKIIQIDDASQARMTAAHAMAQLGTLPLTFAWVAMDNTSIPMGPTEVTAMASTAGVYVFQLRGHFWSLRGQIMAAPDRAAALAIDLESGWPTAV